MKIGCPFLFRNFYIPNFGFYIKRKMINLDSWGLIV